MTVVLRSPGAALPGTALAQDHVRDVFAAQPGRGRPGARLVPAAFDTSSLFGDGAAAAVITGREFGPTRAALQLDHFETVLTPAGEEVMARNVGDNGFEKVLGAYVPHIVDGPSAAPGERICGMAFGPGLTVEYALLTRTGAAGAPAPAAGDRAAAGDVAEALDAGSGAGR